MEFQNAIIYQVFPDRFYRAGSQETDRALAEWGAAPTTENFFGGDLQGILARLSHLKRLGADTLLLNPIFAASTNHRYDTVDYYKIDPLLGSEQSLHELVNNLHQQDMHLILDGVFNHCGRDHRFFRDVEENEDSSPYRNWFEVEDYPITQAPLNYQTCGACPYLPKFNFQEPIVQSYLLEVARYWTEEFAIDGWRLDSAQRVPASFWRKFQTEVKKINPDIFLTAELWHDASLWFQAGIFDSASNYPLREVLFDFLLYEAIDGEDFLYEVQRLYKTLGKQAHSMLNLLGCHDTPRIATLFEGKSARRRLAILLQFCLPGIPHIYYGDEIGLPGAGDPDCRRTMEWDEDKWDMELFRFYRDMISLRRQHNALRDGNFTPLRSLNQMIAFKRTNPQEELLVVLNRGELRNNITLQIDGEWRQIYPRGGSIQAREDVVQVENLAPGEVRIYLNS